MSEKLKPRLAGLKVRIKPTLKEQEYFRLHFGATRFAYNCCLAYFYSLRQDTLKTGIKRPPLQKLDLQNWWRFQKDSLIKDGETWLSEVNQSTVRAGAHRAAFAIEKHVKKLCKKPKFKSKSSHVSARWFQGIRVIGGRVHISRQSIRAVWHKKLPNDAKIKAITISVKAGQWYASILHETSTSKKIPNSDKVIGVDLGLANIATLSDGTIVKNNRPLQRRLRMLRRKQRRASRCQKGSNRRKRAQRKVAALHAKIANTRLYHAQQLAWLVVNRAQTICLEDLRVSNMAKNAKLARHIHDAGWYQIRRLIQESATKYGRQVVVVPSFFPSSKLCSNCGHKNDQLTLRDRAWTCPACHTNHDRDLNAAINIRNEGIRISGDGRLPVNDAEGSNKPPAMAGESDEPSMAAQAASCLQLTGGTHL